MKKRCLSIVGAMVLTLSIHAQDKVWTLDDCISYAISHNINVQQRVLEINQRDIALNSSKKAWLPDLNVAMKHMYGFENPTAAASDNNLSISSSGSASYVGNRDGEHDR